MCLGSNGCLLDFVHDGLDLLADLGSIGVEQITQLVDFALQDGAQVLGGGLQLALQAFCLGLHLLAQALGLGLQEGGEAAQPLCGGVMGLAHVGLHVSLNHVQVLGGAGLELRQVSGHSAGGQGREEQRV